MERRDETKINDKVSGMVGKEFLYKTNNIKVLSFKLDEQKLTIVTEEEWIEVDRFKALAELKEFLPAEPGQQLAIVKPSIDGTVVGQLRDELMENIRKVRKDPNYIPQAAEINSNVKTIVDLAKAEIEMVKTLKGS